jgi:glutamate--cysteine ligase
MSDLGYRTKTQARLAIVANSLDDYLRGLEAALTTVEPSYASIGVVVDGEYRQLNANILQIENEYYSSIRPKPSKESHIRPLVALRSDGVEYVEIRTLDLSPTDPVGINQAELRFLEALLVVCLLTDSPPIDAAEQAEIDRRDLVVAREGRRPNLALVRNGRNVGLRDWGLEIAERVGAIAELLESDGEGYVAAVELARRALEDPDATPSAKLLAELRRERTSFFDYVLGLARRHREYFLGLDLDPDRERWLAAVAERSRAEAAALERTRSQPFAEYLKEYSAAI